MKSTAGRFDSVLGERFQNLRAKNEQLRTEGKRLALRDLADERAVLGSRDSQSRRAPVGGCTDRRRQETISEHIDDSKEEMANPALVLISSTQKRPEILFVYNAEEYIKKLYVSCLYGVQNVKHCSAISFKIR